MRSRFDLIGADITDNCNLRCQFCFNDFSKRRKTVFMKEPTFRKLLDLLRLVDDGRFLISCLYEPTIHPRFIEFMEMIPRSLGHKAFFTTNLTVKMSDDSFERLSRIPFHHINISVDSFKPTVYEELRNGGRFSQFMMNLERLIDAFSRAKNSPPIHYVTVALKSNLAEIPEIIERCSGKYMAEKHEVRHIYSASHMGPAPFTLEWKKANLLSNEEWDRLTRYAEKCPFHVEVSIPPDDYFPDDGQPYSKRSKVPPPRNPPLFLAIDSEGTAFLVFGDGPRFNLDDIERPYEFFKDHILVHAAES